uniref:DNA ligase n=1 Tax=Pithovirus LCPAC102 TaxID=2506587 RepID=A0A4D5XFE9_9VIRU|nr:MAG: ATP-dependent DNA ligase [Pithovirus LCPAC102]
MIDDRFICNINDALPLESELKYDQIYEINGEELLSPDDTPVEENWVFPHLYIQDQNGGIRIWKIGFNSLTNEIIRVHGNILTKKGNLGKLQIDKLKINMNTRSINIQSQALLEARNYYRSKYRDGYRPAHEAPIEHIPHQLAQSIINKKTGKWRINNTHLQNGITCQGKLDGYRGLIWPDNMKFKSRNNIIYKWLTHIIDELIIFFSYLPDNVGLDGELYNHKMNFNQHKTAIYTLNYCHSTNINISFYIFDIVIKNIVHNDRITILNDAYINYINDGNINKYFIIMPIYKVYTYDNLINYFNYFINNKYEGMIVRKLVGQNPTSKEKYQSLYRGKRNNNLLKMKPFDEDEGLIIGIEEAKGRDIGSAKLNIEWKGKRFKCRPNETLDIRKTWFENPMLIIGKIYTFVYYELSEYNIPRHPTGKGIRDSEYKWGKSIVYKIYPYDNISILLLFDNDYFYCIPSGDKQYHIYILNNINTLIGKYYNYRYMEITKSGGPENPIGIEFDT